MTPKPKVDVDVVVVGAGLSGLRAAVDIQNSGLSCVVLEAMDRVGGKTLSVMSSPGSDAVSDLGAAWINDTNQSRMYAMALKYKFKLVSRVCFRIFSSSKSHWSMRFWGLKE